MLILLTFDAAAVSKDGSCKLLISGSASQMIDSSVEQGAIG